LFSVRYLPWLSLLISCTVYNDALRDDSGESGVLISAGSGKVTTSQAGHATSGGTKADDPEQTGGEASSKPSSAGTTAGTVAVAGGSGGAPGAAGSGVGVAGTAAVAGSANTMAGNNAGGMPNLPAGVDLLDDMEDGNFYLSPKPPRFGYWYLAGDATVGGKLPKIEELIGTLAPPRDASTSAVHFIASGFKDWGASVGLTFADAAQKRTAYDSGNALGISFWVRGSVTDNAKLRVLFPLVGSDPSGKTCGGSGQGQCLDHFASQVSVTSQWQQVTVLFSALHQAGWGVPLDAFEPKQMLGIEWTAATANLDIWIDDLALIRPL
jgi:hypothetical protein